VVDKDCLDETLYQLLVAFRIIRTISSFILCASSSNTGPSVFVMLSAYARSADFSIPSYVFCPPVKMTTVTVSTAEDLGLEVLRRFRAEESTQGLPVVIFTSSLHEQDKIESWRLGPNEYVAKPPAFRDFGNRPNP
jgi:DNA-binding NarL/FixJ family response regulator